MLEVFATSRAIRSFHNHYKDTNTLLPKAITIAELEQKAILVPHRFLVDDDMRVLLMQEASRFTKLELLHIDREFFTFLKNSTYLFRFFEELMHEKVTFTDLLGADTYAHYEEHLEVLETLFKHYRALLEKHQLFDRILLPECYKLNEPYILSLGAVRLHLEGFLSRFEIELLSHISTLISLHILVSVTPYNLKIAELFKEEGITLEVNHTYEIDFSLKKILHVKKIVPQKQDVYVYGFASRFVQIGYIKSCIEQFVCEGLSPDEIVVVLPDESFAPWLGLFDFEHNLNLAMGTSIKRSHFYTVLSAIEKGLRYDAIEDKLRLERLNLDPQILFTCKELWQKKVSVDEAFFLFDTLLALHEKEQKHLLFQELFYKFRQFLTKAPALRFEQVVRLLLNRLSAESFDDVRGGKVTVLGLLETRGVVYKGVIMVDFNDDFVPKRSQKDLFLSSTVRAHAKLPTKKDRENLQRYYYHQLFSKAQKVAISYVKNDVSMPSRFLDELGFESSLLADEKLFYPLFFTSHLQKAPWDEAFIDAPYDLKKSPLSATKLKTLLGCKRAFYFRYIAKLAEAKMPTTQIDELSIGKSLHKVLENYLHDGSLIDETTLRHALEMGLKSENSHEVWGYFTDLWIEKLTPFIKNEVRRFDEGYRISQKECTAKVVYEGFVLEGQIDRIDTKDNQLFILDYKSGKVPTTTVKTLQNTIDFQLVFYALMGEQWGDVSGVYYYDLKRGTLVEEIFLEEKKALLQSTLQDLAKEPLNGYERCNDPKQCRLCPYTLVCGQEELA